MAFLLAGCGNQYVKPCQLDMSVTLDTADGVDAECRGWQNIRNDYGNPITRGRKIRGCSDIANKKIVTIDNDAVIAHEVRHQWGAHCKK